MGTSSCVLWLWLGPHFPIDISCYVPTDQIFLSRKVPVLVAAAQYLQKTAQKILTAKDCTENMNGSVSSVISVKKYFGDYIEAKLDENIFNSHEWTNLVVFLF